MSKLNNMTDLGLIFALKRRIFRPLLLDLRELDISVYESVRRGKRTYERVYVPEPIRSKKRAPE